MPNYYGDISVALTLDEKGRCCGRKPLTYKRGMQRFCHRCNRAYGLYQPHQIDNWAWKRREDGLFVYSTGMRRHASQLSSGG